MAITLITGASSGIGAAVCRRVAVPGAKIVLHARGGADGSKAPLLEQNADEARAAGAEAETVLADLSQPGAATELVEHALSHFGGLDQIVSNAGFADRRQFSEVPAEELDRSYTAMTRTFFELAQAALEPLSASANGRVVAISSFVAHVYANGRLFPVTAAAKAGVEALAKSLAAELAPKGVTVNCIAPGYTRKETAGHSALSEDAWKQMAALTPLGKLAEPDDIARLVEFLLGPGGSHITGQVIHVDGGLTLA